MEYRFRSVAQIVDSWVILAILGRWACVSAALLFWLGLIESTPYSLVAGNVTAFPVITEWVVGGASWLLAAVLWVKFVRLRVAFLEAGSNPHYR